MHFSNCIPHTQLKNTLRDKKKIRVIEVFEL